jgi:hypothetical protein
VITPLKIPIDPAREAPFTTRLQLENPPVIAGWNDLSVRGRGNLRLVVLAATMAAMLVGAGLAGADRGRSRNQNQQGTQQAPTTTVAPSSGGGSASRNGSAPGQGGSSSVQGVVQAIFSSTVLVKQLDGTAVVVPVDRHTQVFVNGRPAQWSDVKPGFVLIASWQAGRPPALLRFLRPS